MLSYRLSAFSLVSLLTLAACGGGSDRDDPQRASPVSAPINQEVTYVVFSPATSEVPIPSDLQFAAETAGDGTMFAGDDPSNPVITGIDFLDGNSVLSPMDINFTDSLDDSQTLDAANFIETNGVAIPNPNQNVFLLPLIYPSGDGLNPTGLETPTFAEAVDFQTAAALLEAQQTEAAAAIFSQLAVPTARAEIISLDGGTNNVLRINPIEPLAPKTKYLVLITDVQDNNGQAVQASQAYEFLKDPASDLDQFGNDSLTAIRPAIIGWETLAAGYFAFMQSAFDAFGVSATAPSADDIIFSLTFTTGGTVDTLNYAAAPESFFDSSIRSGLKMEAIAKLVGGQYTLAGTSSTGDAVDDSIAATLNTFLTSPTLPITEEPNPLYDATISAAISAGATYETITSDNASAGYLLQLAAAEAAVFVNDNDDISIATEALGTVNSIAQAAAPEGSTNPVADVFQVPAPRTTNFYRSDAAVNINDLFDGVPAVIHQGEITLPYYQTAPSETDLSPVQTSVWTANETIGSIIDVASGNDAGTTPPSDKITYRYPFPTKTDDITVPLMAVTPDETTLGFAGITKPENGWPVIIFVHGITGDRSDILPMASALATACIALDPETQLPVATGLGCYASIAIDQPLHGVAPSGSRVPGLSSVSAPNFAEEGASADLTERHFNVTADASASPVAMTYEPEFGSSGSLFVNLLSFATARDNQKQMAMDLLNLNASIASMDLDNNADTSDLDVENVYFIGHSLGGITGLPFVAVNNVQSTQDSLLNTQPKVKAAVGVTAGGGVIRLLTNSPSFAPTILGGLAAASDVLVQGNSSLESYLNVFQGALDSADIMNFASSLSDANSDTGIMMIEVIDDQTIPNSADEIWGGEPLSMTLDTGFVIDQFPAPNAGTEPLIAQFDAIKTADVLDNEADADDGDADVIVTRYVEGNHGTPVTTDPVNVFGEMVIQIVRFFDAEGNVSGSIVVDTSVVEE